MASSGRTFGFGNALCSGRRESATVPTCIGAIARLTSDEGSEPSCNSDDQRDHKARMADAVFERQGASKEPSVACLGVAEQHGVK